MQSTQEKLAPLGCFIVVQLESVSGLAGLVGRGPLAFELPAKMQGKVGIARILAAGPGVIRPDGGLTKLDVEVGDKVLVMRAGLMPVDPLDDNVFMALASNCVAKIVAN